MGGGQQFIGLGRAAQPIPDGLGVIAATGELNTGFGFPYKRFLHVGATVRHCGADRQSGSVADVREEPMSPSASTSSVEPMSTYLGCNAIGQPIKVDVQ